MREYTPRPPQLVMRELFLREDRCNGFARMGMGKTVEALTCIDYRNAVDGTTPTLVIAPKRVCESVWPYEADEWAHLSNIKCVPVLGNVKERLLALKQDANVFAINYENIPWLVAEFAERKKWPFKRIIADESGRLRNFRLRSGGKRSTALAKVAHHHVREWVNLNGSPVPNGLQNLWGQQWFVDCGKRLGNSYTAFKDRWFTRAWDGFGIDAKPLADEQIKAAIADVSVYLRPEDWFPIEAPVVRDIHVDLPPSAMVKYKDMARKMYAEFEHEGGLKGVEAVNAAAKSVKCLQIANGAAYIERGNSEDYAEVHQVKLEALESIIEENSEPILVAYRWKSDAARILKAFPEARTLKDPGAIADWNKGKIPLMLIHPDSGGHGLNLQHGGRTMVFFGLWWDLDTYEQVIERIGPMRQMQSGYKRSVIIYRIVARDTVDEDVVFSLETKCSVQDALMRGSKRK